MEKEVKTLELDEINDTNLNPDGIEVDQDMINEDLELQTRGTEEDLVQDTFNEYTVEDMNDEGTVVENEHKE